MKFRMLETRWGVRADGSLKRCVAGDIYDKTDISEASFCELMNRGYAQRAGEPITAEQQEMIELSRMQHAHQMRGA